MTTPATTPLTVHLIATAPVGGANLWEASPETSQAVTRWLERQGITLEDAITGYKRTPQGLIRFTSGVGYNVIDRDLLDGDGSGATLRRFQDEMGRDVEVVRGRGRSAPTGV